MLTKLLINAASNYPHKPAIVCVKNTISYADLLASSISFSGYLSTKGVIKTDAVAVLLPNSPEFVICTFAIARMGAIMVPINTQYREEELKFYLQDSSASVIVTTPELEPLCKNVGDLLGTPLQILTEVKLVSNGDGILKTTTDDNYIPVESEGLYQYSTGSTGTPKRVTRTQRQLINEADNFHQTTETTNDDRILAVAPFFHAHGFGNCILAAVRVGATLVIIESFGRRKQVITTLIEKKITIFPGVPFMFSILADAPSISTKKLTHLRLAFSAGAPLNKETLDGFSEKFGTDIKQLYGSTETGSICINTGSIDGDQWESVGKPMHNVQVRIVKESGEDAQINEQGEIVIKSNAMTTGYANLPEATKTSFINGEFWSGDLGKKDSYGNIYITGRKKLFINAAGNKVDPGEIEKLLLTLPKIKEAVVLGIKGSYGLESIKAVIVSEGECDEQEIRDWCQGKVADFKIPRIIEFRDEIPKSPLGKVLRKYLIEGI